MRQLALRPWGCTNSIPGALLAMGNGSPLALPEVSVTVQPYAGRFARRPQGMGGSRWNPYKVTGPAAGDLPSHLNFDFAFGHDDEFVRTVDKARPDLPWRIAEDVKGEAGMICPYDFTGYGDGVGPVYKSTVHAQDLRRGPASA